MRISAAIARWSIPVAGGAHEVTSTSNTRSWRIAISAPWKLYDLELVR